MISDILDWVPILWTARVVALILLCGVGLSAVLYFGRFCRPKHFWAMLCADLPRLTEVGGEILGNKIAVKMDQSHDRQLAALATRVAELERARKREREVIGALAAHTMTEEEQRGLFDQE